MCRIGSYVFGEPYPDPANYCERMRDSFPTQPANAWSSIPFIILGFYILCRPIPSLRPAQSKTLALLFMLLGAFSFLFHACSPNPAGCLDFYLILVISAFLLLINFRRYLPPKTFAAIFLATSVVMLFVTGKSFDLGVLAAMIVSFILSGLYLSRRPTKLILPLGFFLFSLIIWALSKTGGPLCFPDSCLQGHALWHILMAFVFYILCYSFLPTTA